MTKEKKVEEKKATWLVKDFDGEKLKVSATSYELSGNGLQFFDGEIRIAHFLRWSYYRQIV